MSKGKKQYEARLENQKKQLERHGNFAEVVIRTTPEGTDMLNFARLWEHILIVADRQTRGYVAKGTREDFNATKDDFDDSITQMIEKMQTSIERHNIDLTGTNFVSRIAQRYGLAERKRKTSADDTKDAKLAEASVAEADIPQVEEEIAKPKVAAKKAKPAKEVKKSETEVDGF